MKRNWSHTLREKMEGHEMAPDSDGWQKIEQSLFVELPAEVTSIPLVGSSARIARRRKVQNLAIAASLGGILVCGALLFSTLDRKQQISPNRSLTLEGNKEKLKTSNKVENIGLRTESEPAIVKIEKREKSLLRNLDPFITRVNQNRKEVETYIDSRSLSSFSGTGIQTYGILSGAKIVADPYPYKNFAVTAKQKQSDRISSSNKRTKERRGFSFGPIAGQLASNSTAQNPGYLTLSGGSATRMAMAQLDAPYANVLVENLAQKASTEINHHTPVTYGLAVQYPLTSKWSLSSGVSYTLLRSDLKAGTETSYWESRQDLHYIGVPLFVNYEISETSKVRTYAYGGGEVKKVVAASSRTKYVVKDEPETFTKEKLSEKPLQVSLNAGVGLEYRLHKNISLYVEPGIEYHLNDNSSIQSLYKDKPVNVSLRTGLRFTIGKP
ncbi:porin family protein [Chryseobacterium sp. A301]